MTELFDCSDAGQRPLGIASAVSALKGGRLVVLPTEISMPDSSSSIA